MKKTKNQKRIAILTTIVLLSTILFSTDALSTASAHDPPIEMQSYPFLAVNPNPVGVGQTVTVLMFLHAGPPGGTADGGDRYIFNLFVTTPNGENQSLGKFISDAAGTAVKQYVPDETGTYKFTMNYPGQVLTGKHPKTGLEGTPTEFLNDTFLPSTTSANLTVQEEQLTMLPESPLPTEYWSRPIEVQNSAWSIIGSNWVGGSLNAALGVNVQEYGSGPLSSHIRWTLPVELGGIVGGTENPANFWGGGAYSERLTNPLILSGRLFFQRPLSNVNTGGGYVCVDLQTGEILWENDNINPTKAQLYNFQSENQHGVVGGTLWQEFGTTWSSYDAFTGKWLYNLTNVPAGFEAYTDQGEIVRYVLNYQDRWLAMWNNTDCQQGTFWRPNGKSIDMSNAYSWNVTIPDLTGVAAPSIFYAKAGDIILGTSSSWPFTLGSFQATSNPVTVWAFSDKPETKGQLLWIKNYTIPADEIYSTRSIGPVDPVNRVFMMYDRGLTTWHGYSLDNGAELWAKKAEKINDLAYYIQSTSNIGTADGNLFTSSYGGEIVCYSTLTGDLLWKYNNTFSGLETPWGHMPIYMSYVAGGVLYAYNNEHSANDPLYKGYKVYAINATTGEEIWTLPGWMGQCGGSPTYALADGALIYYNSYDGQVYCIGKGSSATTVSAPDTAITLGQSIMIKGTVTDTAAGTKQTQQATRFPGGVAAVSEESMSQWMAHIYEQKPTPTNATGVLVTLSVVDANNNYREIGTTTSDANGFYSFTWIPDIEGKYTLYASFAGSESYWPSHDVTAFEVSAAPATIQPTTLPPSAADIYFVPAIAGLFAAIIAVGALLALLLLKKHP